MINTNSNASVTKRKKWLNIFANVAVGLGIFALGLSVGNGTISIGGFETQNNNLPENLNYTSVEQIYDALKQNYDGRLDIDKLLDGLKHGLANSTGDPYTSYFTINEAKDFRDQLNGTFQGIGAELSKDEEGNLIVVSPISGFPAEKAGLKAQDIIISVNDEPTLNMSVDQAVSKIRGPSGTVVKLKIIRNKAQSLELSITRTEIKIDSVSSKTVGNNIGYIRISEFSSDTGNLAQKAVQGLKSKGVKGVILDLRGNPGGELSASVEVAELWLKKSQTILTTRRADKIIDTYKASTNGPLIGMPTVVLIDEGSASASEIVAGALHDNKSAVLTGEKSFGKGSVQDIVELANGGLLKVTITRWFTPSGKNIDKQGIEPAKKVSISEEQVKVKKDPQLEAAINQLN